jgi:hypothetical protein
MDAVFEASPAESSLLRLAEIAALKLSDDHTIVICDTHQTPTAAAYQRYVMATVDLATAAAIKRILIIDRRLSQSVCSLAQVHAAGEWFAQLVPHRFAVAVVVQELNEERAFFENVVCNRGLYLRYFTDITAAMIWLEHW